jgi:hypothetical protein
MARSVMRGGGATASLASCETACRSLDLAHDGVPGGGDGETAALSRGTLGPAADALMPDRMVL